MTEHDDPEQPTSAVASEEAAATEQAGDHELSPAEPGDSVRISARKLESNRLNGAKGGVKTEQGKRKSRRNALKHGMRATTLLVEDETEDGGFRELCDALEQEYKPRTTTEYLLMEKMALAILRTRSGRAHEKQELALDSAFQYPAIDRLVRYGNAADKLFFKSLTELQKQQKEDVNEQE